MKKCPVCPERDLDPALTKEGIEVDFCSQCGGIWLDRDEIYLFSKRPTYVKTKFNEAFEKKFLSARKSPFSNEQMFEIPMFDGDVHINYCEASGGIWIDKQDLAHLPSEHCKINIDDSMLESKEADDYKEVGRNVRFTPELVALPNLAVGSTSVLFGMYAILTLVLITLAQFTHFNAGQVLGIGIIFSQCRGPGLDHWSKN